MQFSIKSVNKTGKGLIYNVDVKGQVVKILLTYHAEKRTIKWGLSVDKVLETLLFPDEVLTGHRGRFIAHKKEGLHVIRVVYEYENDLAVVVTVYYPYARRYFKGGGYYADRILP